MRNKTIILLIVAILLATFSFGQKRDSSLVRAVFKHGLNDTKNLFISPSKWDKKDWLIFGGISLTTGAFLKWADQPVYDFVNTLHNKRRDVFFTNAEPLGHIYPAMAMTAMFLKGMIYKDSYSIETGLIVAESYILTGLVTQIVKNTAGRNRPNNYNTTTPYQWNGPFFKGASFFSGHTSTAFSVASVFAYRYKETKWVPILSYGLATIAGAQRIYNNRHWASDVLFGAAVGTATGIFLCKQWETNSIKFYPVFTGNGVGLSMVVPIR